MTWVFIIGVLYGIIFILNVKLCRHDMFIGYAGSVADGIITVISSIVCMVSPTGPQFTPTEWFLPFLALCFFFMPNYITVVGYLLDRN